MAKISPTTLLLLCLLAFPSLGHAEKPFPILIVVASKTGPSGKMLKALRKTPGLSKHLSLQIVTLDSLKEKIPPVKLLVSVGSRAAQKLMSAKPSQGVMHTLIPRSTFEKLQKFYPNQAQSALFIDQPIERRYALLRVALPQRSKVVSILGPSSKRRASRLIAIAKSQALQLSTTTVLEADKLVPSLARLLAGSEVFFAIPDAKVVNAYTSKNLLLTTYRKGVPVLGYSKAYVKAGALLAVHSTPADIGRQLGEILLLLPTQQWQLPAASYPKYYAVAANYHVARTLGIKLKSEDFLTSALQDIEAKNP